MTRLPTRLLLLLPLVLITAAPATPVAAQASASRCTPQSGSDEEFQQEIARSWLPFRIGVDVARASCRVGEFFDNLLKRQPDPDKVTLDDVVEASKPDSGTRHDASYDAKRAAMPSPTSRSNWNQNPSTSIVVLPPATAGGGPVLFQPNLPGGIEPTMPASVAGIQGNGTLLSAEGMKRGTFKDGKLNGVGEEIDPDGTWRAGTYDRGTNVGQVFEVKRVGGRTYLTTGTLVDGKRDGMIERVFADGSTQFEDWENGQLMQVGNRAPKGQHALAPQQRYKPREEVAMEDAYKHTGPRAKIAPGTTFNPARTIARPSGLPSDLKLPQPLIAQLIDTCAAQFADITKQAMADNNQNQRDAEFFIWHLRQNHYAEYMQLPDHVWARDYLTTLNGDSFYNYALRQDQQYPAPVNDDRFCVASVMRRLYGARP